MNTTPELQEAFSNAAGLASKGRDVEALNILDSILLDDNNFLPAWSLRAQILEHNGNQFDAILNYNQAIQLAPTQASNYNDRGLAYAGIGRYQRALEDYDTALEFNPNLAQVWNNKLITYRRTGQINEALHAARTAVGLDPTYADAHLGLAMCLLENMEFAEGWKEFEWRWKNGSMPERKLPQPVWKGESATGPTDALLIYGEQGFGDILQFMRYVKHAKKLWGGPVYVECRHPMVRLMNDIEGVDIAFALGEKIPVNVVKQIAMMSVPALVGTEKGFEGQYVFPDKYRASIFADYFRDLKMDKLRVGICWAGQRREEAAISAIDARRSMSLNDFALLGRVKGISWVSLQKGPPAAQIKSPPVGMAIADFNDQLYDFYDTAALIQNLDLVITVDTAVCHLAAAIGKPVFMLSRFDGCWRWFGDRSDSPWYPSLRQFRQQQEGNWEPVIENVWRSLQRFAVEHQTKAA